MNARSIEVQGVLHKLQWRFEALNTQQTCPAPLLRVGTLDIDLSRYIGHRLQLHYTGSIRCSHCGQRSRRSFSQGYCYGCFKKLARCDLCIMSPTRCHYDQGTCREPQWAEGFCFAPHSLYLANSSGLKVGITGAGRELNRWADQGAVQAQVLLHCQSRQLAGQLEAALTQYMSDRTHWRALLSGDAMPLDLDAAAERALQQLGTLPSGAKPAARGTVEIQYPISHYGPVRTVNLEKSPLFESTLLGIKGQYLLFEDGVLNVRRHTAFDVELTCWSDAPPQGPNQLEIFSD